VHDGSIDTIAGNGQFGYLGDGTSPVFSTWQRPSSTVLDSHGDEMDLLANLSDTRAMANPARELDRKRMGERIGEALSKLTPRERMVFELKHYQGLKLRTIGEMLSTTEETAKNTLFRATRKLRANLAELKGQ